MLREAPLDRVADLPELTVGLSSAQVAERTARYGGNRIVETPPSTPAGSPRCSRPYPGSARISRAPSLARA